MYFLSGKEKLNKLHRNNSNSRQADYKVRAPNNFIHVMPGTEHNIVNQVVSIDRAQCNKLLILYKLKKIHVMHYTEHKILNKQSGLKTKQQSQALIVLC